MSRTICPDCGHATHVTADNRLGNHPGTRTLRCAATGTVVTTETFEGGVRPTPAQEAADRYKKREAKRVAYEARNAEDKRRWAELVERMDKAEPTRGSGGGYSFPRIHVVSGGLPGHGRRR